MSEWVYWVTTRGLALFNFWLVWRCLTFGRRSRSRLAWRLGVLLLVVSMIWAVVLVVWN